MNFKIFCFFNVILLIPFVNITGCLIVYHETLSDAPNAYAPLALKPFLPMSMPAPIAPTSALLLFQFFFCRGGKVCISAVFCREIKVFAGFFRLAQLFIGYGERILYFHIAQGRFL